MRLVITLPRRQRAVQDDPMKLEGKHRTAAIAIVVAYVAWCFFYIYRTSFVFGGQRVFLLWDDAMISMRYAQNFAAGHGLLWNPDGERVQGYSNLGVTLLLAALHELPVAHVHLALGFQLLNVAFLVVCVVMVHKLAYAVFEDAVVAHVSAVVTMCGASLAILSLQGTDVGLVTAILLTALYLTVAGVKREGRAPFVTFLLLALGVVVRIDFAILYVVIAAAAYLYERRPARAAWTVVPLAIALGGVTGFSWLYYGDPLPNTYYLKATGCPKLAMLASGLGQEALFHGRAVLALVVTAIGVRAFFWKDRFVRLLVVTWASLFAYDVWVGGDWIFAYTSRFYAPAVPIWIVLFCGSLRRLVDGFAFVRDDASRATNGEVVVPWRLSPARRVDAFVAAALLSAPCFSTPTALVEWLNPAQPTMAIDENRRGYELAEYLHDYTAPDTTIALHWAGILSYFSERPSLDVLGKSDRHIAHLTVTDFAPGHSKWDWGYIVDERRPDIIDFSDRGLGEREDFRAEYEAVLPGTVTQPAFYLRRSSKGKLLDTTARHVAIGASDGPTPP